MDPDGLQRGHKSPALVLKSLLGKRRQLQDQLKNIEKQIYDLETSYLQDSSNIGNVLKGFDGYLSSAKSATSLKRSKKFQPEDRIFSLSSVTSPASEELGLGREEGKSDLGPSRSRGRGFASNGQGKPKSRRTTPRDGKKIESSGGPDVDDDYHSEPA